MKIHSAHRQYFLQFGLCLLAFVPLPSQAEWYVPNWLNPVWLHGKVMDFHVRNTERLELAQAQAKPNANGVVNANAASAPPVGSEQNQAKANLAPVETANVKVNEKHLTKEELIELRKQLRQK